MYIYSMCARAVVTLCASGTCLLWLSHITTRPSLEAEASS